MGICRVRETSAKAALYVLMLAVCVVYVFPSYWIFTKAINGSTGLWAYPPQLIPRVISLENFQTAEKSYHISRKLLNSAFVCVVAIVGATISSAIVAYGFARMRFKGKKILFAVLLGTMMIPWDATVIPQFIMFTSIGWQNTYYPLIVPLCFGVPLFVFLLRQFIMGIPYELDEAAIIDGCNRLTVFTRIIAPLLKPALMTAVIMQFLNSWNEFLNPLIYLNKASAYTISLQLFFMKDPFKGMDWPSVMAGSMVAAIFPVLLFFFTQKLLIGGIAQSGIKG
jgi:multiple sugar transport system permease protein